MMQKTFKTGLIAVFAMAASMFTFTSCSDDDDNSKAPSVNSNPLVTEAKVLLEGVKYVDDGDWVYKFYYDDQLRPYRSDEADGFDELFYIDYKAGKINLWGEVEGLSVSFNSKGYITKISGSVSYEDDEYGYVSSYSGSMSYVYSYDANGQLTSIDGSENGKSVEDGEVENYKYVSKCKLTWKDGNLVKYETNSTEEGIGGDYDGKLTSSYIAEITYGNQPNKYRQYPKMFCDDDFSYMAVGMLGVGPKDLPQTWAETYHENGEDGDNYESTETERCSFTLNDDGTIDTEGYVDDARGYVPIYKYHYIPTGAASSAKTKVAAPLAKGSAKAKIECLRKALGAGMFKSHGQSRRAKLHNR